MEILDAEKLVAEMQTPANPEKKLDDVDFYILNLRRIKDQLEGIRKSKHTVDNPFRSAIVRNEEGGIPNYLRTEKDGQISDEYSHEKRVNGKIHDLYQSIRFRSKNSTGFNGWWTNGEYHRIEKPAQKDYVGVFYYIWGREHREDGPATVFYGDTEWVIHGIRIKYGEIL